MRDLSNLWADGKNVKVKFECTVYLGLKVRWPDGWLVDAIVGMQPDTKEKKQLKRLGWGAGDYGN